MFDSDPFKGKTWAITGGLKTMNRTQAVEALTKRGAKVAKSVSSKTDVLVSVGYNPSATSRLSNKELKARQHNIPIINENQLMALLDGQSLEHVEQLASTLKPQPQVATSDALIAFRELVHDEPSHATWTKLCTLVDACAAEDFPIVLSYLQEHLAQWPVDFNLNQGYYSLGRGHSAQRGSLRRLPDNWRHLLFQGEDHPKFQLVQILDLFSAKMTGGIGLKVLNCPSLNQIQLINLGRNKLSGAFFKAMRQTEHLATITHVELGDSNLSEAACKGLIGPATWRATHLSLKGCTFKGRGLPIALSSPCWSDLTHLNLSNIRNANYTIADDRHTAMALANAPHICNLSHLSFDYNHGMSPEGFQALFGSKQLANLSYLSLASTQLTDAHLRALSEARQITKLRHLSISSATRGLYIESLLHADHLQQLDHLSCSGQDGGLEALATSSIRPLTLRLEHGFNATTLQALLDAKTFERTQVLRLSFETQHGDDTSEPFIADLLRHPTMQDVEELMLGGVCINDALLSVFVHEGQHLGALKSLWPGSFDVSQQMAQAAINAEHLSKALREGFKQRFCDLLNT